MKRRLLVSLTAIAVLLVAFPLMAQDPASLYTRVASWQIEREHWDAYERFNRETQKPILDMLLADGVIVEYGFDATAVHTPKGSTHSNWFTAKSLANLEKALAAIVAADQKLSPEQRKMSDTIFAGQNHADRVMESLEYRMRTTTLSEGYDVTRMNRVKAGKGTQYRELWQKHSRPVFEQLFKENTVTAFGLDAEYIHTEEPGLRVVWFVVPNAEALDKVDAAFATARKKLSKEENEAITRAFADVIVEGSHRDGMYMIRSYAARTSPSDSLTSSGND
jgi:hypothetical protein